MFKVILHKHFTQLQSTKSIQRSKCICEKKKKKKHLPYQLELTHWTDYVSYMTAELMIKKKSLNNDIKKLLMDKEEHEIRKIKVPSAFISHENCCLFSEREIVPELAMACYPETWTESPWRLRH